MEHADFVAAWRADRIRVEVDPQAASLYLSARLLLPFVAIAVIGLGIALVFWGHTWTGIGVGLLGIIVPRAIKRHAGRFLLSQIVADRGLYEGAMRAGALRIMDTSTVSERARARAHDTVA